MTSLMLVAFFLIPTSTAHAHAACGPNYHQSNPLEPITTSNGTLLGTVRLYVSPTGHNWCGLVVKNDQSVAQGIAVTIETRVGRDTDRGLYYWYAGPVNTGADLPCVVRGSIAGNYAEIFTNMC